MTVPSFFRAKLKKGPTAMALTLVSTFPPIVTIPLDVYA